MVSSFLKKKKTTQDQSRIWQQVWAKKILKWGIFWNGEILNIKNMKIFWNGGKKNLWKLYCPLLREEFKLQETWLERQWAAKPNKKHANMPVAMAVPAQARAGQAAPLLPAFSRMGRDQMKWAKRPHWHRKLCYLVLRAVRPQLWTPICANTKYFYTK